MIVQLAQQFVNAAFLAAVYALFSVGYTLVFGVLDVLNLAHATIFMLGAVLSWFAIDRIDFGALPPGIAFVVILIGVFIVTGLLGVLLDRIAFAPLRRRNAGTLPPLISSIGVSLILIAVVDSIFGSDPADFSQTLLPTSPVFVGAPGVRVVTFSWLQVIVLIVAAIMMIGLQMLVTRTKLGLAIRTVAENPRAARLVGINVERVFMQTFFIASGLGGVAGVLFAMVSGGSVATNLGANVELLGLTAIIIGGLGSIPGAVLGSTLIAFIQVFSVQFSFSNLRDALVFGILIVMLVLRPNGLLGQQALRKI